MCGGDINLPFSHLLTHGASHRREDIKWVFLTVQKRIHFMLSSFLSSRYSLSLSRPYHGESQKNKFFLPKETRPSRNARPARSSYNELSMSGRPKSSFFFPSPKMDPPLPMPGKSPHPQARSSYMSYQCLGVSHPSRGYDTFPPLLLIVVWPHVVFLFFIFPSVTSNAKDDVGKNVQKTPPCPTPAGHPKVSLLSPSRQSEEVLPPM